MKVSGRVLVAGLLVSAAVLGSQDRVASARVPMDSSAHVKLVFGHPTRLTVSLFQWSRTRNPNAYVLLGKGTTQNRATITRILGVLNQVNVPSNLPHSCPALPNSRSVMQFGYSNGDTWTVYEGGCWDFSAHGLIGTAIGDPAVFGTLPQLLKAVAGVNQRR